MRKLSMVFIVAFLFCSCYAQKSKSNSTNSNCQDLLFSFKSDNNKRFYTVDKINKRVLSWINKNNANVFNIADPGIELYQGSNLIDEKLPVFGLIEYIQSKKKGCIVYKNNRGDKFAITYSLKNSKIDEIFMYEIVDENLNKVIYSDFRLMYNKDDFIKYFVF